MSEDHFRIEPEVLARLQKICARLYDPQRLGAEFDPKQPQGDARLDLAKRLDGCIHELTEREARLAKRAKEAEEAKVLGDGDTDIHAYRKDLEDEFTSVLEGTLLENDGLDMSGWATSRFLSVEVWTSDQQPDCPRVEVLLTCGGPTVRLTYDHGSESAELYHSWGKTSYGEERHTVDFRGDIACRVLEFLGVI